MARRSGTSREVLSAISRGLELVEFIEQHGGIPGERLYRTLVAEACYGRQIGDGR
jgi:hypothetical protein